MPQAVLWRLSVPPLVDVSLPLLSLVRWRKVIIWSNEAPFSFGCCARWTVRVLAYSRFGRHWLNCWRRLALFAAWRRGPRLALRTSGRHTFDLTGGFEQEDSDSEAESEHQ